MKEARTVEPLSYGPASNKIQPLIDTFYTLLQVDFYYIFFLAITEVRFITRKLMVP